MPPPGSARQLDSGVWAFDPPPPPPPPPDTVCRGGCGRTVPPNNERCPLNDICLRTGWVWPWFCCGHGRPPICPDCQKVPGLYSCPVCGREEEYC